MRWVKRPHIPQDYPQGRQTVMLFSKCSSDSIRLVDEDYDRPVTRDDLLFTVEMGLSKAERLWPKKRVPGDHDRLKPMARALVEHLELCRMWCFAKPPRPHHSTPDPWGPLGRPSEEKRKEPPEPGEEPKPGS